MPVGATAAFYTEFSGVIFNFTDFCSGPVDPGIPGQLFSIPQYTLNRVSKVPSLTHSLLLRYMYFYPASTRLEGAGGPVIVASKLRSHQPNGRVLRQIEPNQKNPLHSAVHLSFNSKSNSLHLALHVYESRYPICIIKFSVSREQRSRGGHSIQL